MQGVGKHRFVQPVLLLVGALLVSACGWSADWRFDHAGRVVALSDVHGAVDGLRRTLLASGLTDNEGHWQGRNAHLVVTGDLLDRGADSRAAMDLVMRLGREARAAGGRVHMLLGNHEVMNLVGDLRYVTAGEYAAFADEEDSGDRQRAYAGFLARAAADDSTELRAEFEERHPPGFFGHRRAFAADGRYGKWLLRQPLLVVINGTAFVHGGLAPIVSELGLEGVNRTMGDELRRYVEALSVLEFAGLLLPGDSFYQHRELLQALPDDASLTAATTAAVQAVLHDAEPSLHDADGPLWYRGNAGCSPLIEGERLAAALQSLRAERVVIGHTPTVTRSVVSRLDGRIIEIDTGMNTAYYGGSGHALVIDGAEISAIDESGARVAIGVDPRANGAGELSAAQLQQLLATGRLQPGERRNDGTLSVTVTAAGQAVQALFRPLARRDLAAEVAAYRLDRLLDLQMVPAAVLRSIDGQRGSLQLLPGRRVSEAERAASNRGGSAWCPLDAQWRSMYLFDALIYQQGRSGEQIHYDGASWQLFLQHHDQAFSTRRDRPAWLRKATLKLTDGWRNALLLLNEERLEAELGDLLNGKQRRALMQRRDALLAWTIHESPR